MMMYGAFFLRHVVAARREDARRGGFAPDRMMPFAACSATNALVGGHKLLWSR
jgi:hypothetical protein